MISVRLQTIKSHKMEERGLAAIINQYRPIERLQFQLRSADGSPRRFDLQIPPAADDFKIEANLWPSALVLSQYLFFHHKDAFKSSMEFRVMELGAGLALPSLVLASSKSKGRKIIYLQDRPSVEVQSRQEAFFRTNSIPWSGRVQQVSFDWSHLPPPECSTLDLDLIYSSDTLYDPAGNTKKFCQCSNCRFSLSLGDHSISS